MNSRLQRVQSLLRRSRLLGPVEWLRYAWSVARLRRRNDEFRREHPDFAVPPSDLAYDAYTAPAWHFYKKSGEDAARVLADLARVHLAPQRANGAIYEWGCGPGRIVRHLPAYFSRVSASDYNPRSIAWCREHIPGVRFEVNGLEPPLPYQDASFDVIYAVSVLTHLSEATGMRWVTELRRVLAPGGILMVTLKGDSYVKMLLPDERRVYDDIGFVVRDRVLEGSKMFGAFHSPAYVRNTLLRDFTILTHEPDGFRQASQDLWLARKPT